MFNDPAARELYDDRSPCESCPDSFVWWDNGVRRFGCVRPGSCMMRGD